MRFLFDQSADFRLIPYLQHLGHDVTAISRQYPAGLPDEDVLAIAASEHRILIAADQDFGDLAVHLGLPHAGILLFRLPGASLETKISHLDRALRDHAEELVSVQTRPPYLVLSPGRIRARRLSPG